jgi:hypothetical protein
MVLRVTGMRYVILKFKEEIHSMMGWAGLGPVIRNPGIKR